jgi:5-formyltetrahydrofolate cyclo-ligase
MAGAGAAGSGDSHTRGKKEIVSIASTKTEWREIMKKRAATFSGEDRARLSQLLVDRLRVNPLWTESARVLAFVGRSDEPGLTTLLEGGLGSVSKRLFLPRFSEARGVYEAAEITDWTHDLVRGKFGISEPGAHCPALPLNQLDLILVPGVAFDAVGHRLGRGRGFYDRILAKTAGKSCGLSFDWQLETSLPVESHDQKVHYLITPTRFLVFEQSG